MLSRKACILAVLLGLGLLLAGAAIVQATDGPPSLPAFYNLEVKSASGGDITTGTAKAYIDDQQKGELDLSKLKSEPIVVYGDDSTIGKPVTFKVTTGGTEYPAVSEPASVLWNSGDISSVKLTIEAAPTTTPETTTPETTTPETTTPETTTPETTTPETTTPETTTPETVKLVDIDDSWAKDKIETLVSKGIVGGYPDNTFRPNNQITRAECVTILVKALNLKTEEGASFDSYSDASSVPEWAKPYLAAAIKAGLVKGSTQPDGKISLSPQEPITRVELAVIASRVLAQNSGSDAAAELTFADKDQIPAWGQDGVKLAVAGGIIKGYPDNTFAAAKQITRAECAVIALNLLEKK